LYFATRALNDEEMANWENYPVVNLTPNSDNWDPHSLHFADADAEASMMDCNGDIVGQRKRDQTIFEEEEAEVSELYSKPLEAGVSELYAEPCDWETFHQLVDYIQDDPYDFTAPLTDDDVTMLAGDGIRAQVASISSVLDPSYFTAMLDDQAMISKLAMAVGSTTFDDTACDVFEARVPAKAKVPIWDINASAISAGRSHGVTADHLLKIWRIPFDDAARTLEVTTQGVKQNPDSSLSRNASTNDRAVWYRWVSKFFTDTLFATKWA